MQKIHCLFEIHSHNSLLHCRTRKDSEVFSVKYGALEEMRQVFWQEKNPLLENLEESYKRLKNTSKMAKVK